MSDIPIQEQHEQTVPTLLQHFLRRGRLFGSNQQLTFSSAGSFENKILMRNGGSSGVKIIIFQIRCDPVLAATTSQENMFEMRIQFNPTVSANGTNMGENNKDAGSATGANAIVTHTPTITLNGTRIDHYAAINEAIKMGNYILDQGDSLLIRARVNDAANDAVFSIAWAEDDV